jgi:hypothetical protein
MSARMTGMDWIEGLTGPWPEGFREVVPLVGSIWELAPLTEARMTVSVVGVAWVGGELRVAYRHFGDLSAVPELFTMALRQWVETTILLRNPQAGDAEVAL